MSLNEIQVSKNGHFVAQPSEELARRMELDSYLMMHANRSLSLRDKYIETDAYKLDRKLKYVAALATAFIIPRVKVIQASGELTTGVGTVTFRAINRMNRNDTIYRIGAADDYTADRITVPPAMADLPLEEIDLRGIANIEDMTGDSRVVLSVLRGASMLCEHVRNNPLLQEA